VVKLGTHVVFGDNDGLSARIAPVISGE